VDWGGPRNHVLDMGPDSHTGRGNFKGKRGPGQDMPGGRYTQSNSAGAELVMQMPVEVYYIVSQKKFPPFNCL